MCGFNKIPRDLYDTEIYKNSDIWLIFCELIRRAKGTDKINEITNKVIQERGSAFCGLDEMASLRNLTKYKVRNALKVMKDLNVITLKTARKGSIVTFCNYGLYNGNSEVKPHANNTQTACETHANNMQTACETQLTKNERKYLIFMIFCQHHKVKI